MIVSGGKLGEVKFWRRVDPQGNWLCHREVNHHDKCNLFFIN